jgi:cytochrome c oxidase subunit 3
MGLVLASLTMGLGAVLVFYLVMRGQAETWPPPGTPELPVALWLSTAILLASSGTMHLAVRSVRRGRRAASGRLLSATLLLAIAFIVSQVVNWGFAVAAEMPPGLNMFSVSFYLLTGLHGLHVLGGLVPLTIVTVKALRGLYSPQHHDGVRFFAWYWHFVDVAWLIMFGTLLVTA